MKEKNQIKRIRVAVLAEEPMGWGSGKHYFPAILDGYTWTIKNKSYIFSTRYLYDRDILTGKLNIQDFDVLLVPGGGVGDGQSIMKGFTFLPKVRKWKKNISEFVKNGGGYVGICGGTALITGLKTGKNKKPITFLERQYNKSSLGVSCVFSYYKTLAFPLFYPFQKRHPENIGVTSYIFSFAPGETSNGVKIYTGGVPLDFKIFKDNPIFSDISHETERIRWWGGPALILPEKPDRDVKILAVHPEKDISDNADTNIYAWRYSGGIIGLVVAFIKALKLIKDEKDYLKNVFIYTYYLAGNWELTEKKIELDYSNKPSITAEIYPNKNKGRILLCTSHPEYMIWWNGHIEEMKDEKFNCIATGLHKWKDINPLSKSVKDELTHSWWILRRFVAWAAKVPDDNLPPIESKELTEREKKIITNNIICSGNLLDRIKNI